MRSSPSSIATTPAEVVRVLVVGSGGREHAIVSTLIADEAVDQVHSAPGNPGIADVATCWPVDIQLGEQVAELARRLGLGSGDLVVIGPEGPLVAGVADAVRASGIPCFGPSAAAAMLEGSKAFAKTVMAQAQVPTALSRHCTTPEEVDRALAEFGSPYVVKDDALAAGKGVVVTSDLGMATDHARACLDQGSTVVIEEYLDGPEVSLFGITDGTTVYPMLPAQDFKRVGDGDSGPNTGGMGAYAPVHLADPWSIDVLVDEVQRTVLQPTVDVMRARGTPFIGLLYAGLAITSRGIRVIEFNARFGDPETQAILALLDSPLGSLLHAAATGSLASVRPPRWRSGSAVTVVLAAPGYPSSPELGGVLTGVDGVADGPEVLVRHAGTTREASGRLRSSGGRVLSITGLGSDISQARDRAYAAMSQVSLPGGQVRRDIAARARAGRPAQ